MNSEISIKRLSAVMVAAIAALVLVACSKPAPVAAPVRSVKVMTVGLQSLQAGAEFSGDVRAQVESRLGFRVGGKLSQRSVELGEHVKVGQVLAQLDPQDYQLAAESARAQLAVAASNRDLAVADYKRFKELKDQNFISGAEFERRTNSLNAAQAQYEQAKLQLTAQGNQTAYTRLIAGVSGVVTAVEAEQGQVLAAGTPVVRVAQDGPRDVVFSVPEDKVSAIKVGTHAQVRVWATDTVLQGVVREVAASADPVTRTFVVKVSLADGQAPALGATVSVLPQVFDRGGVQVIKLPTSALRLEAGSTAVWVLDPASMTVRTQVVQVATADGNDAVIASGLKVGMQVVTSGVHVLSSGQQVNLYQEKNATASPLPSRQAVPATNPVPVTQ